MSGIEKELDSYHNHNGGYEALYKRFDYFNHYKNIVVLDYYILVPLLVVLFFLKQFCIALSFNSQNFCEVSHKVSFFCSWCNCGSSRSQERKIVIIINVPCCINVQ